MSAVLISAAGAHPGLVTGRFYTSNLGASGTQLATESRLYFMLFYVPQPTRIDRIGYNISTGAGDAQTQVQFGAYANLNGVPGALIVDGGKVTVGTGTGDFSATVAATLPAGFVWLCAVSHRNGGATGTQPTFRGFAAGANQQTFWAGDSDGDITTGVAAILNDQVIGTWGTYVLPSTAPALTYANGIPPAIFVRAA
jgi:hypothetical protein